MKQVMHGELEKSVFTCKRKPVDVLLVFIYFVIFVCLARIVTVFQVYVKRSIPLKETLTDPSGYLYTFIVCLFFMSPIGVYFRKVPKLLCIEPGAKIMEISKRKRTLHYDLERIRFCMFTKPLFVVLEIHISFESSRGEPIEKLGTSIVVPKWGLSMNQHTINEIAARLRECGVEENRGRKAKPLYQYLYE